MPYEIEANRLSPALLIYLIDISRSMKDSLDGLPKIEHVHQVLEKIFVRMIQRSRTGPGPEDLSDRYYTALFAYSDEVLDSFDGALPLSTVAHFGLPEFTADASTNTWAAFRKARDLLLDVLPTYGNRPAPLVCHLTDGQFTGADPEPMAREIMGLTAPDGPVLIENIFIGSDLTHEPVTDPHTWPGIGDESELSSPYAAKLFRMSSPLPGSYAEMLRKEGGYQVEAGRRMLIPGASRGLVELAFTMSQSTPTNPR